MLIRLIYNEILHVVIQSAHALDIIENFMEIIDKEILNIDGAMGIPLQIADIHLEEMHKCFIEYDSFKIKQPEIEAMLEPFLICLQTTTNPQIF
jgi:hypothetical protein